MGGLAAILTAERQVGEPFVALVVGAPGVGKSELARHAASMAFAAGHVTRALFIDMNGYDQTAEVRVRPEEVYGPVLLALGIPSSEIAVDPALQAVQYRESLNLLAEANDHVLLVIDNVSDSAQVEPLLPEGGGHRIIVTSRDTFALPSARRFEVDVLDRHSSIELIAHGIAIQCPGDQRIAENPYDAGELARLCGDLPLALQIVAALLGDEPERELASLVDELDMEATRLSGLEFGTNLSVRAAFELSYRQLSEELSELFRLLPSIPGEDAALETVAALINTDSTTARQRLRRLTRTHLIERPVNERWRMHDLIRLYAAELGSGNPSAADAGFRRVVRRIGLDVAAAGIALFHEQPRPLPRMFTSESEAAAWCAEERRTIVGLVERLADGPAYRTHVPQFAYPICLVFERLRFISEWVAVASAWTQAVEAIGDRPAEAIARNVLGSALRAERRFDEALAMSVRSFAIYSELGDERGRGVALNNQANVLQELGRSDEAIELYRGVIEACVELDDVSGQAGAWNNLGAALVKFGRFQEASSAIRRAGELYNEVGDSIGKARVLNSFGAMLQGVGMVSESVDFHLEAADAYRANGDGHARAGALNNAATALTRLRQFDEAIQIFEGVLEVALEMNDDHLRATTLDNIGLALLGLTHYEDAIESHRQSIELSKQSGDMRGEARANFLLADVMRAAGHIAEARVAARRSLTLFESAHAPEAVQARQLLEALGDDQQ